MVQTRKHDIEQRIVLAAREVFAERGFAATSIAEIAARAGISTGNVYRYFPGKEEVFERAVPVRVARELRRLLSARVQALGGAVDVAGLPADAPYRIVSEELMRFCVAHRLEVVILLGNAQATAHERLAAAVVRQLVRLAITYAGTRRPAVTVSPATRFVLVQVYRGLVAAMVNILAQHDTDAAIRAAVDRFSTYHLTGLARVFETESSKER